MDLRAYLEATGESDYQFAKRAGVSRTVVNRVKRGQGASAANLVKIAKATHGKVDLEKLIPSSDSPPAGGAAA